MSHDISPVVAAAFFWPDFSDGSIWVNEALAYASRRVGALLLVGAGGRAYHAFENYRHVQGTWDAHLANPNGDTMMAAAGAMGDFLGRAGGVMSGVASFLPLPPQVSTAIELSSEVSGTMTQGMIRPIANRSPTVDSITSSETMWGGVTGPNGDYID